MTAHRDGRAARDAEHGRPRVEIPLMVPASLLARIEAYQDAGGFATRAEATRDLLRAGLDARKGKGARG